MTSFLNLLQTDMTETPTINNINMCTVSDLMILEPIKYNSLVE